MAQNKMGTTIGGHLAWHSGNLEAFFKSVNEKGVNVGKVRASGTTTIGGSTVTNGVIVVNDKLGIDSNEIYSTESLILGTVSGSQVAVKRGLKNLAVMHSDGFGIGDGSVDKGFLDLRFYCGIQQGLIRANRSDADAKGGMPFGFHFTSNQTGGHASVTASQLYEGSNRVVTAAQGTAYNSARFGNLPSSGYLKTAKLSSRPITDANSAFSNYGIQANFLSGGASSKPSGTDHALLSLNYSSSYGFQLACDWRTNTMYSRVNNNGTKSSWQAIVNQSFADGRYIHKNLSSQTIDGGASSVLVLKCDNAGESVLSLRGDSQGTGRLFVGQSTTHGGGIEYNGDGTPGSSGSGADYTALYRVENGAFSWTARNQVSSNNWEFRAEVKAASFSTVNGRAFFRRNSSGAALYANQQGSGVIAEFRAGSGDGTSKASIDKNGGFRIGSFIQTTNGYAFFRRNSTSPSLHVCQQGNGAIAQFRAGAGDGTVMSQINKDGSYYTTAVQGVIINATNPTVRLQDSDGKSSFIHQNNNVLHVLRSAGNNGTTWDAGPNGRYPMKLDLNTGDCVFSGNVQGYSDARLKTKMVRIPKALDKISKLRGITYYWKDATDQPRRQTGLIAQEVEKVLPEVVVEDEKGFKTIAYANTVGLLVEGIKEERAKREALEKRLEKLEQLLMKGE